MTNDHALMISHERKKNSRFVYRYVNLLYYNQRSLQHVSATYCGYLQGGVF